MGFLQILDWLQGNDPLTEAANHLARRTESSVWQRVEHRLGTMPLDEGRGYIRARAAMVVDRQAEVLLTEQPSIESHQRSELVERATEAVIARVIEIHLSAKSRPRTERRAA